MSISGILGDIAGVFGGGNQQQNAASQAQQQMNQGYQILNNQIRQVLYYDAKKLAEEARWNAYLIKCNNVTKETK